MATYPDVWYGKTSPGSSADIPGRVTRIDSTTRNRVNVVQADLASIAYTVTSGGKTIVASTSLTISSVIFDTLQLTSVWDYDQVGYNFFSSFPGTCFPNANTVYLVEVTFKLTGGDPIPLRAQISTGPA